MEQTMARSLYWDEVSSLVVGLVVLNLHGEISSCFD